MSQHSFRAQRKKPSQRRQETLLSIFKHMCAYCDLPFGTLILFRRKERITELVWDHIVPYSYTNSSHDDEFIPACSLCNSIKHSHMYDNWLDAKYGLEKTVAKYQILWVPPVSSSENPEAWARAYTVLQAAA